MGYVEAGRKSAEAGVENEEREPELRGCQNHCGDDVDLVGSGGSVCGAREDAEAGAAGVE